MESSLRSYHVEFLQAELERRKTKNPRYSMRAFASFLEIHPSALSRILNGLQEISLQVALLVLKQLKMSDEEKRLFLASVAEEKRFRASQVLAEAVNLPLEQFLKVASVGTPHLHTERVLSVAPFYTFVVDVKRRFLFASDSGATWLNFKPCELIGREIDDVNLTDGFAKPMSELYEAAISGVGGKREIHNEDPQDHAVKYFEITASPLHSPEGAVTSVVFAIHDVTAQKSAQMRIEEQLISERKLRQAAEQAVDHARLLQGLSTSLFESNTQADIANNVVSRLLGPLEAAGGVILLMSHDGRYLEPIVTPSPKTTLRMGRISLDFDIPAVQVAKANSPIWMQRIGVGPEDAAWLQGFEPGVRWVLAVPLVVHGHVLGVLGLRFRDERVITPEQKSLIETVANLAAQALDKVQFSKETERNRALLDTIFHEAPVGILFIDKQLRTVRANDELARYAKKPLNALFGKTVREFPVGTFERMEPFIQEAVTLGREIRDFHFEVDNTGSSDQRQHFVASIYPIRDSQGEILGAGAIVNEETNRVYAQAQKEKRRTLLINAGRILGSTLNSKTTLSQLTQLIVPAFAVGCRVDLIDQEGRLRMAVTETSDADVSSSLKDPDFACAAAAWENRKPEFMKTERGSTALCVPIEAEGQAIGTLTLVSSEENGHFFEKDVEIAVELAERAALAIRNAQKFEEIHRGAPLNH